MRLTRVWILPMSRNEGKARVFRVGAREFNDDTWTIAG